MASQTDKQDPPPYTSYVSFSNFIKTLKENGVPARIDRSVMDGMSGSQQSAMLTACKWLGLVDKEGMPTTKLHNLVDADDTKYSTELRQVLDDSYNFLKDPSVNLLKVTGGQFEELFREKFGITGSTVVKSIAFFLAAAKAADIKVSPHIKPPKVASKPAGSKRSTRSRHDADNDDDGEEDEPEKPKTREGMMKITVPLAGMQEGEIWLPDSLTPDQWDYAVGMAKLILEHYRPGKKGTTQT